MAAKYLILRHDGTVPEWPAFVLGASDPAAYAALTTYRRDAERRGYDPAYLAVLDERIAAFEAWAGKSVPDPDAFDVPALTPQGRGALARHSAHARNLVARLLAGNGSLAELLASSRRALGRA